MNNLDLVLFSNTKGFFKPTSWDSVGIVINDPTWLYPGLKGTYIWGADNRLTPWSDHFAWSCLSQADDVGLPYKHGKAQRCSRASSE